MSTQGTTLRVTTRDGRLIEDLALPGDTDTVLRIHNKRAWARDSQLTWQEQEVRECTFMCLRYHTPVCLVVNCQWCGGTEIFERHPLTRVVKRC